MPRRSTTPSTRSSPSSPSGGVRPRGGPRPLGTVSSHGRLERMSIWFGEPSLEWANSRGEHAMIRTLGIEMTELTGDSLKGRMPVDDRTRQPAGVLHGGASVALRGDARELGRVVHGRPRAVLLRRHGDQREPPAARHRGVGARRGATHHARPHDAGMGHPHHRRPGPSRVHLALHHGRARDPVAVLTRRPPPLPQSSTTSRSTSVDGDGRQDAPTIAAGARTEFEATLCDARLIPTWFPFSIPGERYPATFPPVCDQGSCSSRRSGWWWWRSRGAEGWGETGPGRAGRDAARVARGARRVGP